MTCVRAAICSAALACSIAPAAGAHAAEPASPRVEARSTDLLAVGLVHGDRMTIRLSRPMDNAPVADASVTVALRGSLHPAIAETDGSYTVRSKELELGGSASVKFQVVHGGRREELQGTLQVADGEPSKDKNNARQMGWWVLNFSVCIAFLWLFSRRRKAGAQKV